MPQSAKDFALRALKRRLLSEAQLCTKLEQKGFEEKEINAVIIDLKTRNFLNDARLAQDLAQTGIQKKLSQTEMQRKLEHAGFDPDLIEKTLKVSYESTDELALAIDILKKKSTTFTKLPTPTALRRAISLLQRRGFDEETIQQAISKVLKIEMD